MKSALLTAFVACIIPVAAGAADAPAKTPDNSQQLNQQIDKLIHELNADAAATRDAAEKTLLELAGTTTAQADEFLTRLPRDNDQMPLALRDRLARIRKQVEDRVSKSAIKETTITLSADSMSLADVLKEIEKQTGNKFVDNRDEQQPGQKDPMLTIELVDEPFWPAIDGILDQAQVGLNLYGGEDALSILGRGSSDLPRTGRATYAGPFRFEPVEIHSERSLRQPGQTALRLHLEIAWEPRLRPIAIMQAAADVEATTDTGAKLAISQREDMPDVDVSRGTQAAELILPFSLPGRDAKKITKLHGTLHALVPGRQAKFQFENLAKAAGKTQQLGGVKVTLDAVRKNNAVWEVHMRFGLDESNSTLQAHQNWILQNLSYLVDKDRKRIETAGFETTNQSQNEVGVAYVFDVESLDGLTWVYETPAAIVDLPVEYQLDDIELP